MKPVSYFIAVFRRAFYDKHFDIQLMAPRMAAIFEQRNKPMTRMQDEETWELSAL